MLVFSGAAQWFIPGGVSPLRPLIRVSPSYSQPDQHRSQSLQGIRLGRHYTTGGRRPRKPQPRLGATHWTLVGFQAPRTPGATALQRAETSEVTSQQDWARGEARVGRRTLIEHRSFKPCHRPQAAERSTLEPLRAGPRSGRGWSHRLSSGQILRNLDQPATKYGRLDPTASPWAPRCRRLCGLSRYRQSLG